MSRIAAGSAEGAEQGYRPYLQAALLMGLFTFLFLCAEYLYVDVLSRMVSGNRAVLAQNEALGVSAVGFLLYPLAERSCRERLRLVLLVLLVALMTCVFSTLDNAVTLVHSSGETDIGQWPRALLALSGLAAGFVFDWKSRQYMGPIMYCVMMLPTTDR